MNLIFFNQLFASVLQAQRKCAVEVVYSLGAEGNLLTTHTYKPHGAIKAISDVIRCSSAVAGAW